MYLENLVGGEGIMNGYLRAHCEKFANSTVNTAQFKALFIEYMLSKGIPQATLDTIDWNAWLHTPGMPPVKNTFDQTLIEGSVALATKLVTAPEAEGIARASPSDLKGWDSAQIVILLETLLELQKAASEKGAAEKDAFGKRLLAIDNVYKFTESKNAEVRFRWLTLCIRQPFVDRYPAVEAFLAEQGRMKYIRPLYR
jgi:hypothetical protein